ncbi:MAG: thermonuclease family protein [Candidatus Saccharibacteria bacterium]|nr:thermonuclease family protein [Candidatus Saccharibacteria bacterium]
MGKNRGLIWLKAIFLGLAMAGALFLLITNLRPTKPPVTTGDQDNDAEEIYEVKSVVDGDTFKIDFNGSETSVRLIGVNTPETVDLRTTVECFGQEASDYLKNLLEGKKVKIEVDSSQTDRDKYNRLLRYTYLNGEDVGYKMISNGYGYEYTYNVPYNKQDMYKKAQDEASKNKLGLWADGVCSKSDTTTNKTEDTQSAITPTEKGPTAENNSADCNIKGNISYSGEKIYHVPGQQYYNSTKINTEYGERWFCSEEEAQAAGWRKAKV